MDPPDGKLPWRPEGLAKRDEHFKYLQDPPTLAHVDPGVRCVPAGVPRAGANQILQSPGQVVLIAEANHQYRVIPLDGRPHVGPNVRTWMGDSIGRWEGQTLIIDTTNFIGGTWYDMVGTYQSDAVHVIERFTIVDADTIDYDVTIDDPKLFTKPWTIAGGFTRAPEGYELYEAACVEGSKALDNILFDRLAK